MVEIKLKKVHILSILDCYDRLFPLIYISYDSEGMTIQGLNEDRRTLATTTIPRDSFESYEFRGEPIVLAVPKQIRELGGKCSASVS